MPGLPTRAANGLAGKASCPGRMPMDSDDRRATIHLPDPDVELERRRACARTTTTVAGARPTTMFSSRESILFRHRPLGGRALVAALFSAAVIALLVGLGVGTNRGATSASLSVGPAPAPSVAPGDARPILSPSALRMLVGDAFWRFGGRSVLSRSPAMTLLASADPAGSPAEMASYNDRPVRAVAVIRMKVTAYSPDERSCGASADGITASGYSVFANGGCMVAADPRVLPLGSLVSVPGYDGGAIVPVLDTGGAIKGNRLDVLYPSHERAVLWGVQELDVTVWEYADGKPNDFRRVRRASR